MTNAQIILQESIKLMKENKIKGTGEFIVIEKEDGTKEKMEMHEQIHTFATWKKIRLYSLKRRKSSCKISNMEIYRKTKT